MAMTYPTGLLGGLMGMSQQDYYAQMQGLQQASSYSSGDAMVAMKQEKQEPQPNLILLLLED